MNIPSAIHDRIKQWIYESVARGDFRPGDRLPSQRELGEQFHASLMTVRRAIDELLAERVIVSLPGKGLYVTERKEPAQAAPLLSFSEDMAKRGLFVSTQLLEAHLTQAMAGTAKRLGVEEGCELVYLRRLRLADHQPIAIQMNWIVHRLCPGLLTREIETKGLFQVLRMEYDLQPAYEEARVEAVLAGEEEAALLNLDLPAALLITEHVTFLADGRAFDLARLIFPGERYQYLRVG